MDDHGSLEDDDALRPIRRVQIKDGARTESEDVVVREEPLEIRIGGVPLAVVMRTPGHDEDLARGFLVTERVVERAAEVASVRHCTTVEAPEAENNVMQVVLAPGVQVDLARLRRNLYASSSCGICGKATIDNVLDVAPPIEDAVTVTADVLYGLPAALRGEQDVFSRTGGLHAAGLFAPDGTRLVVREDVGRHNAVDKTIGWALAAGRVPLHGTILMVSGRVSYEIVQKALAARIPVVAAVSAPSSLAVELAQAGGLTLVAFLRDRSLGAYAGVQRIG
jgi:FdhD protein